jgi:hypothetical protein
VNFNHQNIGKFRSRPDVSDAANLTVLKRAALMGKSSIALVTQSFGAGRPDSARLKQSNARR